jgi:hypothetical protein
MRLVAGVTGAACAGSLLASVAWGQARVTVLASGLDNPRALAVTSSGALYVVEAGHGGAECTAGTATSAPWCLGFTSAITRITPSGPQRILTGLISEAGSDGTAATGLDGLAAHAGTLYAVEAESSDVVPTSLSPSTVAGAQAQMGRLIEAAPTGAWQAVADVGNFDYQWAGAHQSLVPSQFPDANPNAVLVASHAMWVIDAGANTLDKVTADGTIKVVAFFPNPAKADAVPTCIAQGRDGAFYVGELTGFGNPPGSAVVWRVRPGHPPTKWAAGLTTVTGCGFDRHGHFYAVEYSTRGLNNAAPGSGALVKVPPHSHRPTLVAGGLSFPFGFAAGADGALYVSNWSTMPASSPSGQTGQVVRIVP